MPINVTEVLQEFIRNLLSDRNFAAQYAEDPHGMLAAQGVTDHDLSAVDMPAAVQAACADPSVPQEARSAVQSGYGGGGPGAAAGHSQNVEQVIQHLNYVTYQTYEGDEYITNLIDNSVDVDVEGTVFGDVDVNAATGQGSQVIDGDNLGQANTGAGAVQAGGDASGVNTGVNTGVNAGGDVENAVVGDENQTAQVQGSAEGTVFNFGDGDVTNLDDTTIEDSTVGFGEGDVSNVSDNTLEEGSAIASGGGDARGSNVEVEDNDTTIVTETTVSDDDITVSDDDTSVEDSHDTVTAVQDNDTTVEDNDTAVSGGDTVAAQ